MKCLHFLKVVHNERNFAPFLSFICLCLFNCSWNLERKHNYLKNCFNHNFFFIKFKLFSRNFKLVKNIFVAVHICICFSSSYVQFWIIKPFLKHLAYLYICFIHTVTFDVVPVTMKFHIQFCRKIRTWKSQFCSDN